MNRRRVVILVASVVIVVAAAGVVLLVSKRDISCTLAGCANAVTIDLTSLPGDTFAAAKAATACANDRCDTVPIVAGQRWVRVTISERTVRSASLRLTDSSGNELVNLKLDNAEEAIESHPNGPDCGPTCWLLNLTPKDGVLVRSPRQHG